jgi:signal peptidase II
VAEPDASAHAPAPVGADESDDVTSTSGGAHRRWWLIAAVAVVVIAIDQLSKWWALNTLATRTIDVVWTLRFNLARNQGTAFSFGSGSGITRYLPLIVLVVVGVVIWQGRAALTKTGAVALGLVVGGALGNIVDRALRTNGGAFFSGGVVDFIDPQWWPIFNVADSAVVCGGILLVLSTIWAERRHGDDEGPNPAATDAPATGAGS